MLMMRYACAAILALLLAGIPSAERAGIATTNLSVNLISPSAFATPPPQAAAAGLTTLAFGNNFAAPLPNTDGTGLDTNTPGGGNCFGGGPVNGHTCWIECIPSYSGDGFHHEWYQPAVDQGSAPCNGTAPNGFIQQVTDPVYGNLAVDFASGANRNNGFYDTATTMSGQVRDPSDPSQANFFKDFPINSYTEMEWRSTSNQQNANSGTGSIPWIDFWSWAIAWFEVNINGASFCDGSTGQKPCSAMQVDFIEDWGDYMNVTALHSYYNGQSAGGVLSAVPSQLYDQTKYNKVGTLFTSDGHSDIRACAYMNDVLTGCTTWPGSVAPAGANREGGGGYDARMVMVLWFGGNGAGSATNYPLHFYVKSFKRWECADWQRGTTGPNPNCFGQDALTTGSQGELFHQVTVQ